ncbi:MAG: AtpZ/AtpI family protein [Kutzneria sp.]|nr:AtpZ/AtpI family protein [Kutzneria sp.]MBV9847514.1 AtpZ/AtpI family protein [Kutzneria sp.]
MSNQPPSLWSVIGLGSVMAGMVVSGLALGWFADSVAHTLPLFVFIGLALGMASAVYYIYKKFRTFG